MSCQPCGCDPEYIDPHTAGYTCEAHRMLGPGVSVSRNAIHQPAITLRPGSLLSNTGVKLSPAIIEKVLNPPSPPAPSRATVIPDTALGRKQYPIATGVLDYFPDALAVIAHVSWKGNEQHNPGEPLHWARGKSMDQEDCLIRHFLQRGTLDSDGIRHSAKMAWRALALLQLELEAEQGVK